MLPPPPARARGLAASSATLVPLPTPRLSARRNPEPARATARPAALSTPTAPASGNCSTIVLTSCTAANAATQCPTIPGRCSTDGNSCLDMGRARTKGIAASPARSALPIYARRSPASARSPVLPASVTPPAFAAALAARPVRPARRIRNVRPSAGRADIDGRVARSTPAAARRGPLQPPAGNRLPHRRPRPRRMSDPSGDVSTRPTSLLRRRQLPAGRRTLQLVRRGVLDRQPTARPSARTARSRARRAARHRISRSASRTSSPPARSLRTVRSRAGPARSTALRARALLILANTIRHSGYWGSFPMAPTTSHLRPGSDRWATARSTWPRSAMATHGAPGPGGPSGSAVCSDMLKDNSRSLLEDANGAGVVCRHNNRVGGYSSGPYDYPNARYNTPVTAGTGANACVASPRYATVPRHYWKTGVEWCERRYRPPGDKWLGYGDGAAPARTRRTRRISIRASTSSVSLRPPTTIRRRRSSARTSSSGRRTRTTGPTTTDPRRSPGLTSRR